LRGALPFAGFPVCFPHGTFVYATLEGGHDGKGIGCGAAGLCRDYFHAVQTQKPKFECRMVDRLHIACGLRHVPKAGMYGEQLGRAIGPNS
jgi:hypothetical protein